MLDIDEKNNIILTQFENSLKEDGLSTNTIKSHIGNIDFFCTYLSYYDERPFNTEAQHPR